LDFPGRGGETAWCEGGERDRVRQAERARGGWAGGSRLGSWHEGGGDMQLEFHQLDRRYGALRVVEPGEQGRLVASLAESGQRSPVWVVAGREGKWVLIDGYRRVRGLEKLGGDEVWALELAMGEAEGLVWTHRQESGRRRSVVEEGWLVRELVERHGKRQGEVAEELGRSRSWVSRRLALVRDLPGGAEEAVRKGVVSPQGAMKYLVPLARANGEHCERLVRALGGQRVSVREMERLYVGWRFGGEEERERLVDRPHLYLRAEEAVRKGEAVSPEEERQRELVRDLGVVAGACQRVARLAEGVASAVGGGAGLVLGPVGGGGRCWTWTRGGRSCT